MKAVFVVIAYLAVFFYEGPVLLRQKQYPELATACVLVLLGMVLSVLMALGITLPSPLEPIRAYSNLVLRVFKIPF